MIMKNRRARFKLKEIREAAGVSVGDLAKIVGVSTKTLMNWESNITWPRVDKFEIIVKFFGLNCDAFFEMKNGCNST